MITCPPDRVPARGLTTMHEPPKELRSIVVRGLAPLMLMQKFARIPANPD